ncbi:MAG: phytoene/squalene synthase family protein, partial [Chloroflexota bacterium]
QIQSWENMLLARAQEALHQNSVTERKFVQTDMHELGIAYEHCNHITRFHSKTFFMASSLLPFEKRQATRALYAFCRITDDIVDNSGTVEERRAHLEEWRRKVINPRQPIDNPVAVAWADAQTRFDIPVGYADQLIDGVARDLTQTRYETFEDLASYSYGVASTVGLMAMHIIGYNSTEAIPYAVRLGVALQLTNILRDVGEDWRNGRLYLPLDELQEFGLSEADVHSGCTDERWQAFMQFQIDRATRLYAESWYGIGMLNRDGRFAIAAAADLYRAILGDIQQHNYDVFTRRSHVKTLHKVRRLPGIWWRSRQKTV